MALPKPRPHPSSRLSAQQAADRVAARRGALAVLKARYAVLRNVHRGIAADFAQLDQAGAGRIVKRALQNVQVWERVGIASPYYARAWRRILQDPANRIPKMLRGHNANALVQNSPFGFIYNEPKYSKQLQTYAEEV